MGNTNTASATPVSSGEQKNEAPKIVDDHDDDKNDDDQDAEEQSSIRNVKAPTVKASLRLDIPDIPQSNSTDKDNKQSGSGQNLSGDSGDTFFSDDMLAGASPRTKEVFKGIIFDDDKHHNNMHRSKSLAPYQFNHHAHANSVEKNVHLNRIKSETCINANHNEQIPHPSALYELAYAKANLVTAQQTLIQQQQVVAQDNNILSKSTPNQN